MSIDDARLRFATELAREAGALARRMRRERGADFVQAKGPQDFVTEADRAVERFIDARVEAAYPGEAHLGEENGHAPGGAVCWVIDPIDGTNNYMRGMADWGISIGIAQGEAITHGVIHLPDHGLTAVAASGQGAFVNDEPIHVSACAQPKQAMIALGHSGRVNLAD